MNNYSRQTFCAEPSKFGPDLHTWGPIVEDDTRLRSERAVTLVAARVSAPLDEIADALLEQPLRHRYLLVEHLAQTRRATVFAAVDLLLAQEVALKVHHDDDEDAVHRALVEARATVRVDHPRIVRVLETGVHEGWVYTVMELCESNLGQWRARQPWFEIIDRIIEVAEGLAALHDAGIIHADIKPANILIKRGAAKITDLGLSGPPGLVARISGTPGFIAPEVADGHRGEAGDLFALACTAWYCLFDAAPFDSGLERSSVSAVTLVLVERARAGAIDVPDELPAGMPTRLVDVLVRGLSSDPSRRPSLQAWAGELRELRTRPRVRSRLGRYAGRLALAGGFALLGAAGHMACSPGHAARGPACSEPAPNKPTAEARP